MLGLDLHQQSHALSKEVSALAALRSSGLSRTKWLLQLAHLRGQSDSSSKSIIQYLKEKITKYVQVRQNYAKANLDEQQLC